MTDRFPDVVGPEARQRYEALKEVTETLRRRDVNAARVILDDVERFEALGVKPRTLEKLGRLCKKEMSMPEVVIHHKLPPGEAPNLPPTKSYHVPSSGGRWVGSVPPTEAETAGFAPNGLRQSGFWQTVPSGTPIPSGQGSPRGKR